MTLKELEKGNTATIESIGGEGALRQHFDRPERERRDHVVPVEKTEKE